MRLEGQHQPAVEVFGGRVLGQHGRRGHLELALEHLLLLVEGLQLLDGRGQGGDPSAGSGQVCCWRCGGRSVVLRPASTAVFMRVIRSPKLLAMSASCSFSLSFRVERSSFCTAPTQIVSFEARSVLNHYRSVLNALRSAWNQRNSWRLRPVPY